MSYSFFLLWNRKQPKKNPIEIPVIQAADMEATVCDECQNLTMIFRYDTFEQVRSRSQTSNKRLTVPILSSQTSLRYRTPFLYDNH